MPDDAPTLILLSGPEKGPLHATTGIAEKALLRIHNRPMIERVITAFEGSDEIGDIIVAGSDNLDSLAAVQRCRKRVPAGVHVLQTLTHAIAYAKTRLYRGGDGHPGYLISFCDAVFLTPEVVQETLTNIRQADADVVLHFISREVFEAHGLSTKRTWIPIEGGEYTGSVVYYLRRFSPVMGLLDKLAAMRKQRKDPMGLLKVLGVDDPTVANIEAALHRETKLTVRILLSQHPELGMDVDKPTDLAFAESRLS